MKIKQITKYIAIDGKEFECKNECREYENNFVSSLTDQLFVFDEYGTQISLLNDDLPYIVNAVVCKTKKAYEYLNKLFDEEDMMFVDFNVKNFPCSFIYDKDSDQWIKIQDMISDLSYRIEQLNKLIALEED